MRKLVTVRKISNILPIPEADRIEEVQVDGWSVVAQKGVHNIGDDILYFEIDSYLPSEDARYESFMKFGIKNFEGKTGHRVKTKRLKGIYSQGIIMPLNEFPEIVTPEYDVDYSELLGILKYEKQEAVGFTGNAKGSFPWFLRKSDQERIQNLYGKLSQTHHNTQFVGTLKMDGSSIAVAYVDPEYYERTESNGFVYCSRNQELKIEDDVEFEQTGKFYQGAVNSDLFTKAKQLSDIYGGYWAIQGELVGAGIQGGFEKFEKYQVFAYNIFDVVKQRFVDYSTFEEMAFAVGLQTVPVVYEAGYPLREDLKTLIELADGTGLKASYREGIVYKQVDGGCQFKVISNKYLNKESD